jgi:hypothetical protein
MLSYRGVTLQSILSGELFAIPLGRGLAIKLFFVAFMIFYQTFVGHRSAPRKVFLNMMAALVIIALSIALVRVPSIF